MDFNLPVFTCNCCNRKRQGSPVSKPEIYPTPICRYCLERFEYAQAKAESRTMVVNRRPTPTNPKRKKTLTLPNIPMSHVRPNANDDHPPDFAEYLHRWRFQRGLCTICRRRFYQMYAVWSSRGTKLKSLRCGYCVQKVGLPTVKVPAKEQLDIPKWWEGVPWFVREFMWQNPSVRDELAKFEANNPPKKKKIVHKPAETSPLNPTAAKEKLIQARSEWEDSPEQCRARLIVARAALTP